MTLRASQDAQITYWAVSSVICIVSLVVMLRLFHLMFHINRTTGLPRSVWTFSVLLIGDLLFLVTYTPYHLANLIRTAMSGFSPWVELSEGGVVCYGVAYLTIISSGLMLFGVSLAAVQPVRVLWAAGKARALRIHGPKAGFVFAFGISVLGVVVAILCHVTDTLGDHAGLYCAYRSMGELQTGGLVVMMAVSNGVLVFAAELGVRYKLDKRQTEFKEKQSYERLLRRARKVTLCYLVFWLPITLSSFLAFAGVEPPIIWELIQGWSVKIKPLVDVWIVSNFKIFEGKKLFWGISHTETDPARNNSGDGQIDAVSMEPAQKRQRRDTLHDVEQMEQAQVRKLELPLSPTEEYVADRQVSIARKKEKLLELSNSETNASDGEIV